MPHHVLDIWDVTEPASVAEYQTLARAAVDDIVARGRVPLLVGGSGLYVRAVLEEFAFPGTDPAIRGRLEAELRRDRARRRCTRGCDALDPAAAAKILPSNGRRIVRALEVIEMTGAAVHRVPAGARRRTTTSVQIGVDRDTADAGRADRRPGRPDVGGRACSTRSAALAGPGCATGRTAGRALGYQQALAELDGESSDRGRREERDGPRPPGGSSGGSGPGSAATRGSPGWMGHRPHSWRTRWRLRDDGPRVVH